MRDLKTLLQLLLESFSGNKWGGKGLCLAYGICKTNYLYLLTNTGI